jgi:nucleoid-associated protein YgaU
MNLKFYLVLSIVILIGIQPVFAQQGKSAGGKTIDIELASDREFAEALKASSDIELINKNDTQPSGKKSALTEKKPPAEKPALAERTASNTEQKTPDSIRNNEYLLESQRLTKLAEDAYNFGDYDASANFAAAAIQSAELSDEYVSQQAGVTITVSVPSADAFPASYTIRAWSVSHDCFWNIAGRPWVYGNPHQWRVLYNANKAKLPDPNNPNVIEPGTVLDIPSLKGEVRQGAWDESKTYKPLQ